VEDRGGTPSSQGDFRELAAPGFLATWPQKEHLRLETSRDGGEPWTRSVGRFRRKLDLVNFPDRRGPTDGCGEAVRRGPSTPCTGLRDPRDRRPTTDDRPRTGTSDRGRTLRTWESEPAAQASGPRDPRLGLRKFSAWPPMRRVGPSRALDPMPGAPRPAGPTTDDRRPTEDRDL